MRIGLVCPYSFDAHGGVQNHVAGLAHYLRDLGHQPHILAPGDLDSSAHAGSGLEFTSAGNAVPVPYNGSIARVNFGPLSATRVRRWIRRHQFDLLHIHEPITPSISLLATFHTATPRSRSMQLAGGALRATIEKIDAGIAVSESARRVVVQHLGRDAVVVPNGFTFAEFAGPAGGSVSLPWRGGDRPRISFLGRLDEPRKGLSVLLAALPAVRAALGDIDVVIAGQGACVLPPGCRSVGAISDADKTALLASSDVFVAPHVARESFGIVLLEAMASGAPVVASALPAFSDLLQAPTQTGVGRWGRTFAVGDPAALATAVIETVRHPDSQQLEAARQHARRFDWKRVGHEVTEVYRATLASTAQDQDQEGANAPSAGTGLAR
jgi:phosphatidyl-myo-inositol alpha-mannosyltransferase